MSPNLRLFLLTASCAWLVPCAFAAGTVADAREATVPTRAGVAIEPAHRAQVIAPGLKSLGSPRFAPVWVVTEPARQRVLLPGEERSIAAALADAHAQRLAAEQDAQDDEMDSSDDVSGRVAATIYFPFDSARPIQESAVVDAARDLAPTSHAMTITGHADATGPESYNKGLSLRRANSVSNILGAHGIARERMTVEGMGESLPTGAYELGRDRRVEIRLFPGSAK